MKFLITGSAGFIGYHVTKRLLKTGYGVIGVDNFNDYYDVNLKKSRSKNLHRFKQYKELVGSIENDDYLNDVFDRFKPDCVIHLAAQAGVRYSLKQPETYLQSNVIGTYKLLEAAKSIKPKHILLASTSSAYGANIEMPYIETQKTDHQVSIYAATKKSMEVLSHSYSHLFDLPITAFRFFTVYGPYGRPDMAPHKFTSSILARKPIDIYNFGKMERDFTYIDDLVTSILKLAEKVPTVRDQSKLIENTSPVAPWRVVNIGNSRPVKLLDFIDALENALGIEAIRNYLPMQSGDVVATWADVSLLRELTGFVPDTNLQEGLQKFVEWYRDYYGNQFYQFEEVGK